MGPLRSGTAALLDFSMPPGWSADRPPVRSEPNDILAELFALFDAVMAWCAEALEVVWVKEQRLIAFMCPDVVTHRCWRDVLLLQAVSTQWMSGQLPLT